MDSSLMKQGSSRLQATTPLPEGSPRFPELVLNRDDRGRAGVGLFYSDEYNQMLMNQYNNAYNYWLWQMQNEYNLPKNQVARLKDAGLNPNFNSIEGAGNAGSATPSSGRPAGNIVSNHLNAVSTGVSIATGMATMLSKGIGALKTLSSTPGAIRAYRQLLNFALGNKVTGTALDNDLKILEKTKGDWLLSRNDVTGDYDVENSLFGRTALANTQSAERRAILDSKKIEYQDLLISCKEWEKNYYNPERLRLIQEQWRNLVAGTALRNINLDWFNATQTVQVIRLLAPLFIKTLF